jgi:hypothetical protein
MVNYIHPYQTDSIFFKIHNNTAYTCNLTYSGGECGKSRQNVKETHFNQQAGMACTCDPSSTRGYRQEDHSQRPALGKKKKKKVRQYQKITLKKKSQVLVACEPN